MPAGDVFCFQGTLCFKEKNKWKEVGKDICTVFKDIAVYTDGEEVSGVDIDLKIGFPLC